jgi:hypothetical protein
MCTYQTERIAVDGSAKGGEGWFRATDAIVYFDHPVDHPAGHALMVDVLDLSKPAGGRVGLELDPSSARALAEAIFRTLDSVPVALLQSEE